jgi:hypothetical protein
MRRVNLFLTIALFFIPACGGGGGQSTVTGRAQLTILWPDRSRLIPLAANSIRVEMLQNGAVVAAQLLARPAGGSTTATFDALPTGALSARATAYPEAGGGGIAQANGTVPLVIQVGQTTSFTLTMGSTIDRLELSPPNPTIGVGQSVQLTATAKDAAGSVVLTAPSKLQWSSSNGSATVDAGGSVNAVSQGIASISVTDQESGKSAAVTVTITPSGQTFIINGVTYITADPRETLTAAFTPADGGVTVSSYKGYVLLHITGVGQAYGGTYNDAFYLYTAPFSSPQNGHDGGYYQLAFGSTTLTEFSLGSNAKNFLVGSVPPYSAAHDYTVILDTKLATPGQLHFGVTDGGYSDNTGAYTIEVAQLVPAP